MEELTLYQEIVRLKERGEAALLATVIESSGSTPRRAGAKMLVRPDGSTLGSVGGGPVESEILTAAAEVLRQGSPRTAEFLLDESRGLVCGGRMLLYLEPLLPASRLEIIGKGHIAQAMDGLASKTGYRVACHEPPALSETGVAESERERLLADLRESIAADDAILIATPSHRQDFAAAVAALKTPARFVGVVGSRRKKSALLDYLDEEGFAKEERARIVCPVGLDIGAQTPAEIAVSIIAQLIARRYEHAAERLGNPSGRGQIPADGTKQAAAAPW